MSVAPYRQGPSMQMIADATLPVRTSFLDWTARMSGTGTSVPRLHKTTNGHAGAELG